MAMENKNTSQDESLSPLMQNIIGKQEDLIQKMKTDPEGFKKSLQA
jgi:uncharacterized protein (DUF305 family)